MAKDRIQRREAGENADLEDLLDPKVHDRSADAVHQEVGRLDQEGRTLAGAHLEDRGVPLEAAVVAAAEDARKVAGVDSEQADDVGDQAVLLAGTHAQREVAAVAVVDIQVDRQTAGDFGSLVLLDLSSPYPCWPISTRYPPERSACRTEAFGRALRHHDHPVCDRVWSSPSSCQKAEVEEVALRALGAVLAFPQFPHR